MHLNTIIKHRTLSFREFNVPEVSIYSSFRSCQVPTRVCLLIELFSVGSDAHPSAQRDSAVCSELTEGLKEKKQKESHGGMKLDRGRKSNTQRRSEKVSCKHTWDYTERTRKQREKKSAKEGRTQLVVPTAELSLTELWLKPPCQNMHL